MRQFQARRRIEIRICINTDRNTHAHTGTCMGIVMQVRACVCACKLMRSKRISGERAPNGYITDAYCSCSMQMCMRPQEERERKSESESKQLPAWLPLGNNVSFDEFAFFPIARRQRSALFFLFFLRSSRSPPRCFCFSTFVGVQRSHSDSVSNN